MKVKLLCIPEVYCSCDRTMPWVFDKDRKTVSFTCESCQMKVTVLVGEFQREFEVAEETPK